MPISSITYQPVSNSLKAAYSPIVLKVIATATGGGAQPPIVYCDIYFNGVYYKSHSKTQPSKLNPTNSEWEFSIQDAAQEFLTKLLAPNGDEKIIELSGHTVSCFLRFRSSGINANGFVQHENTEPVMATGNSPAVNGTGFQSNSFYIVNATLTHEDNPIITGHLSFYKNGTWDPFCFPATHRSNRYQISNSQSDYFSILDLYERDVKCVKIYYRRKGFSSFQNQTHCFCLPLRSGNFSLPDAYIDTPYSYTVFFTGDAISTVDLIAIPTWMDVTFTDNSITFFGTPSVGNAVNGVEVRVNVKNCSDLFTFEVSDLIDVLSSAPSCVPVNINSILLPDAQADNPYSATVDLLGSTPFSIADIIKPAWMSITLTGSSVNISGTPSAADVGANLSVGFTVTNCSSSNSAVFSDQINVILTPGGGGGDCYCFDGGSAYIVPSGSLCNDGSSPICQ